LLASSLLFSSRFLWYCRGTTLEWERKFKGRRFLFFTKRGL
jgi:hypothetical protein